jgi:hypothetical protein
MYNVYNHDMYNVYTDSAASVTAGDTVIFSECNMKLLEHYEHLTKYKDIVLSQFHD